MFGSLEVNSGTTKKGSVKALIVAFKLGVLQVLPKFMDYHDISYEFQNTLTLPVPCIRKIWTKIKINFNGYFGTFM